MEQLVDKDISSSVRFIRRSIEYKICADGFSAIFNNPYYEILIFVVVRVHAINVVI